MRLSNIFFLITSIILSLGCESSNESVKNEEQIPVKKSFPYDQDDEVYDIINSTLKKLIPTSKKSKSTILINERLLVADKELINEFINRGGNELLNDINRKKTVSKAINIKRIYDFNGIEVLHTYPLNNNELEKHIGGAIYSRIILNSDKTNASFIFHFERLHDIKSKILCAVDVVKDNDKWIILSKTCLENHQGMLFE
jgi:hypothetical protein